ncbi:unnamed protein product [Litomosoides sigmodontis]|uniref:BPTI/Kunitz inhibitor domain-containing protein n=1 Tax=Litomosoides sigmodontis TaxID=42156 RepID=A0A3P6U7P2_LITSI|nr:unnamed protein product [Litomosoides sigmodontis]
MEVYPELMPPSNQMIKSLPKESLTAHSSWIPNFRALPLLVPKIRSFLPSEIVTKQGAALVHPETTSKENSTVETLPEICKLPAVTGPCSKAKVLWYYNSLTNRCERFSFR